VGLLSAERRTTNLVGIVLGNGVFTSANLSVRVAHEKDVLVHSSDLRIFEDEWVVF
jgi:hypothetical protein